MKIELSYEAKKADRPVDWSEKRIEELLVNRLAVANNRQLLLDPFEMDILKFSQDRFFESLDALV